MRGASANNAPSFFQIASLGSPLKVGFTSLYAVKFIYNNSFVGVAPDFATLRRPNTRAAQRFVLQTGIIARSGEPDRT